MKFHYLVDKLAMVVWCALLMSLVDSLRMAKRIGFGEACR